MKKVRKTHFQKILYSLHIAGGIQCADIGACAEPAESLPLLLDRFPRHHRPSARGKDTKPLDLAWNL